MERKLIAGLIALLPAAASAFDFGAGWTLAGNGRDKVIDVPATFGDAAVKANVTTVWKWDPANQKWAFYSPTLADGGAAYATGKGYEALKSILPGEGFWVNAASAFSVPDPVEPTIALKPWQFLSGWNLVSTGAGVSAAQLNASMAPFAATSVWAWDRASNSWYFYTPTMSATDLASYISTKQYRSFGTMSLGHGTGFWVNRAGTGASPTATLAPLDQAKQMVAELRTTTNSWVDATHTGALDAQAAAMANLGKGISVPAGMALLYRLSALNAGEQLFRDIRAGKPSGYLTGSDASGTYYGTIKNDYPGYPIPSPIPGFAFYGCKTNAINATQPLSSVTCDIYDPDGLTFSFNWSDGSSSSYYDYSKTLASHVYTAKYTRVTFTDSGTAGTYGYGAELRQDVTTYTINGGGTSTPTTTSSSLASGYTGSFQRTLYANGNTQAFALAGELPSTTAGSAKMAANASMAATPVSGGACETIAAVAYCPVRYDVIGAIRGVDAQGATVYSFSLDSGSHLTAMRSAAGVPIPTGTDPIEMSLVTTVQGAGIQFVGTIAATNFKFNADGLNWAPTSIQLTGSFKDISAGGVGTIFNGTTTVNLNNWSTYHSQWPNTGSNYANIVTKVDGTLQLPSRPTMGLHLEVGTTGPHTGVVNGQYVYGDGVTLAIAGSVNTATTPTSTSFTLTNQDGVVLTLPGGTAHPTLSKGGTELGSVQNGIVYYADGVFESF